MEIFKMNDMVFANKDHEHFYYSCMDSCECRDTYHSALFYVLGISPDTRANIHALFDFEHDEIRPDGLGKGWQTSGSRRLCRLAMNLWNGYTEPGQEKMYSPYELFDCSYQAYMMEGIKLRYPEYCRELKQPTRARKSKKMEIGG